jgi:hypothetical protein
MVLPHPPFALSLVEGLAVPALPAQALLFACPCFDKLSTNGI